MYARVRTYHIKEGQVDERLKHAREASVPAFKGQAGFSGVFILVDPVSHKNMTVGLWETEAEMHASERSEQVMNRSAHRGHAAGDVATEHFEVRDRGGEIGKFVRTRAYQIAPGQIEERLRHTRDVMLPHWNGLPGHKGHIILIDEAHHKNLTLSFFEAEADMLASEGLAEGQAILANRPHVSGPGMVEHFQLGYVE